MTIIFKIFSLNSPYFHKPVFKPGAFSLDQFLSNTNKISLSFDEKYEVRDVFPDKSKTVDKVSHEGLLSNPLSANPAKWSNTLKQFVGNLSTNCLSVSDHFMNLAMICYVM